MPTPDSPEPRLPAPPAGEPPWVHGHAHEPNPQLPAGAGDLVVVTPAGRRQRFTPADLAALPYTSVPGCVIVSTGHGASGPFDFGGVRLADLLAAVLAPGNEAGGTAGETADNTARAGANPPCAEGPPRPASTPAGDAGAGETAVSNQGANTVAGRGEGRGGGRSDHRDEGRSLDPEEAYDEPRAERSNEPSQPTKSPAWRWVDLVSADGFGARLTPADLAAAGDRPILLAYTLDGAPLTRAQGLVRLIVPNETGDALRQVKWLAQVTIF